MIKMLARLKDDRQRKLRPRILSAIAHGEKSMLEIGRRAKVMTGELHPLLLRMEQEGVLSSRWDPKAAMPRRRLYRTVNPTCGPWG